MTLLLYLGVVVVERYDLYAVLCILETDVKAVVVEKNCTARAKKATSLMNDDIIVIDLILIREVVVLQLQ